MATAAWNVGQPMGVFSSLPSPSSTSGPPSFGVALGCAALSFAALSNAPRQKEAQSSSAYNMDHALRESMLGGWLGSFVAGTQLIWVDPGWEHAVVTQGHTKSGTPPTWIANCPLHTASVDQEPPHLSAPACQLEHASPSLWVVMASWRLHQAPSLVPPALHASI